jgi:hypothetical protein
MIRKLPEDSISKDPGSGAAMFINRGTVTYPTGSKDNIPEVEYKVPEIGMEEAVKAFEKAIKGVSIDTRLGPVFFDIEKLGTNLSAKSIEAALYPAKLESKRIATEMLASLKELVIKLCATAGVEVKPSEFSITMFDGFPKDYVEFTTAIQKRLESSVPSISRVDAIRMLDKVPVRQAIEKSNELQNIKTENTGASIGFDVKENAGELDEHSVNPNPGDAATSNGLDGRRDTNLFENQLIPAPQDVIGG